MTISPSTVGRPHPNALALELPEDYFPEFREAFVIERLKRDVKLRKELYQRLRRSSSGR